MKTLIAYATKYGGTKKIAEILLEKLNGNADLVDLKNVSNINLDNYDKIFAGTSVYAGSLRKEFSMFIKNNIEELLKKDVAIFLCCGDKNSKVLEQKIPQELMSHIKISDVLGYSADLEKMNFIDKFIYKKVAKVDKSEEKIYNDSIDEFIKKMR